MFLSQLKQLVLRVLCAVRVPKSSLQVFKHLGIINKLGYSIFNLREHQGVSFSSQLSGYIGHATSSYREAIGVSVHFAIYLLDKLGKVLARSIKFL